MELKGIVIFSILTFTIGLVSTGTWDVFITPTITVPETVKEIFDRHPERIVYDDQLKVEVIHPEVDPVTVHLVVNVGDPVSARG